MRMGGDGQVYQGRFVGNPELIDVYAPLCQ